MLRYLFLKLSLMLISISVQAQWSEEKKLLASVPGFPFATSEGDESGSAVAVDGNYLLIGVPNSDLLGGNIGIVLLYKWDGAAWQEEKVLSTDDGSAGDLVNMSLAISGDIAVIGAPRDDDNGSSSGSAYVFERNQGGADNWGQAAKLLPDDGDSSDDFGEAVSISGSVILVGASDNDDNGSNSGSAYIFERDQGGIGNWGQVKKLTAVDAASGDGFGFSVSVYNDVAIVGAPGDDDGGSSSGSCYIFLKDEGGINNWGQVVKIGATGPSSGDEFGTSVSIFGTSALVGVPGDDDNGSNSGSAYVFERNSGGTNSWGVVAKLVASGAANTDQFGTSVSISNDRALVGAPSNDQNGSNAGCAYIFEEDQGGVDNWGQTTQILSLDGASDDSFGTSVSLFGTTAIVGAPFDDDNGSNSGTSFIFSKDFGGVDLWGQQSKLLPIAAPTFDQYGGAAALSGNTAIIGAKWNDDQGENSGSAYILERNTGGNDNWGQLRQLVSDDINMGDEFGYSVAVSGDYAIVGAWANDDFGNISGSAYIFERNFGGPNNWGQMVKLLPLDGAPGDRFGWSVSISNSTAIVGAPFKNQNGSSSGAAYIFRKDQGGASNWGQVSKLYASDGAAFDNFGYSVGLSGSTAVVGAYQNDDNGSNSGSAYVFEQNAGGNDNWGEVTKLIADDAEFDDSFGISVSISGSMVIVGANGDRLTNDSGPSGSAYVFAKDQGGTDNWGQLAKLVPSDGAGFDDFGSAVSISCNTALVGAFEDDDQGSGSGSAYIFSEDNGGAQTWSEVAKLIPSDGLANEEFGFAVAISGNTSLIGAPFDSENGLGSGAGYIFSRPVVLGCTDESACNFNPDATEDDESCILPLDNCTTCNAENDGLDIIDDDNDSTCNADDQCPNDPNKIEPGICGCGVADLDSDNDGTPDCQEITCLGDINGDGQIDVGDLNILLGAFGTTCEENGLCPTDINGDGPIDVGDLNIFLGVFGIPCD